MSKIASLTALTLVASVSTAVGAQNVDLRANYGEITLNAGFLPSPYSVQVQAGGDLSAASIGTGCSGMISNAPDFQVTYNAGASPLIIRTRANTDTTLAVNAADGRWYCDDDTGGDLNALVRFNTPISGVYDIWVGSFNGGINPAELQISERGSG